MLSFQTNEDFASVQLPTTDQLQQRSVTEIVASARRALEVAGSFEELKEVRDRAEFLRKCASTIRAARDVHNDIAEIKIRAERRMGEELAKLDKNLGGRPRQKTPDPMSEVFEKPAQPTLAELGVSEKDSSRWQTIASVPEDDFEEHIAEVKGAGDELSTASVFRLAKRRQNAEMRAAIAANPIVLPEDKYSVIVIDPPWPMKKIEREVRPNQVGFDYPTMSEEELAAFPVAEMAGNDCQLVLWTTAKFLPMALRLIEVWGFQYVLPFIWHKPGGFQPIGLPQYNAEFALYATRGTPQFIDLKQFWICFNAPRREHSRKPDEFYDMLRRVTTGLRIDVFSREKRDGFVQHGNETHKFTAPAPLPLGPWLDQPVQDPVFQVSRIDTPRLMPPAAASVDAGVEQEEEPEAPALPAPLGPTCDLVTHGAA